VSGSKPSVIETPRTIVHRNNNGPNAAFFIEDEPSDGVEPRHAGFGKSIVLDWQVRRYSGAPCALHSVINADVDLAHSLDRAPDADKTGLHHEAVASAIDFGLTVFFLDFDET
jgi:hypothetical protein